MALAKEKSFELQKIDKDRAARVARLAQLFNESDVEEARQ